MRRLLVLTLPFLLGACTLVSPYTITFTTPDGKAVNPQTDTLDLVISSPALAYISEVECDGAADVELLPVIDESMQAKTAHNLALTSLNGAAGSECDVTVTAFDRTTSETAQNSIALVIEGAVGEESTDVEEEVAPTEEESGEEPESGSGELESNGSEGTAEGSTDAAGTSDEVEIQVESSTESSVQ